MRSNILIPRIEQLTEKKLVGKRLTMSFANNKTGDIWRSFMPRRKEVTNTVSPLLYSMQLYTPSFFDPFDPNASFEKWAAVEVSSFDEVPEGMEAFTLPAGSYAVFLYRGPASAATPAFQYILGSWLPGSEYVLDNRPHFELLGDKYKNEDADSEEEIWIPVRLKNSFF